MPDRALLFALFSFGVEGEAPSRVAKIDLGIEDWLRATCW